MSYLSIGPSWVAHSSGFTVQVVDGQRITYIDPDRRVVLRTQVLGEAVHLAADRLTTSEDSEAEPIEPTIVLTRIAAGLIALGVVAEIDPGLVDPVELATLLIDAEQLSPSDYVALADALAEEGTLWEGDIVQVMASTPALVATDSLLAPDSDDPPVIELETEGLRWAVDRAVGLSFASHEAVRGVELVAADGAAAAEPATSLTATTLGQFSVVIDLDDPETALLSVRGSSSTLRISLDPDLALAFLIEAEAIRIDLDGEWSHEIAIRVDGVESLAEGLTSVSGLALWAAAQLLGIRGATTA